MPMTVRIAIVLMLSAGAGLSSCSHSTPYDDWQYERVQKYLDETYECLGGMKEDLQFMTKRYSPGQEPPAPIQREHLASLGSKAREQEERTKIVCREIRTSRPDVRRRALGALDDGAGLKTQREWLSNPLTREVLKEAQAEAPVRRNVEAIERFLKDLKAGLEEK